MVVLRNYKLALLAEASMGMIQVKPSAKFNPGKGNRTASKLSNCSTAATSSSGRSTPPTGSGRSTPTPKATSASGALLRPTPKESGSPASKKSNVQVTSSGTVTHNDFFEKLTREINLGDVKSRADHVKLSDYIRGQFFGGLERVTVKRFIGIQLSKCRKPKKFSEEEFVAIMEAVAITINYFFKLYGQDAVVTYNRPSGSRKTASKPILAGPSTTKEKPTDSQPRGTVRLTESAFKDKIIEERHVTVVNDPVRSRTKVRMFLLQHDLLLQGLWDAYPGWTLDAITTLDFVKTRIDQVIRELAKHIFEGIRNAPEAGWTEELIKKKLGNLSLATQKDNLPRMSQDLDSLSKMVLGDAACLVEIKQLVMKVLNDKCKNKCGLRDIKFLEDPSGAPRGQRHPWRVAIGTGLRGRVR